MVKPTLNGAFYNLVHVLCVDGLLMNAFVTLATQFFSS